MGRGRVEPLVSLEARMIASRRSVLLGLAAALAAPAARADSLNFDAAATYSSARRGVSLFVMQGGDILFEDYPNDGGPDAA